MQVAKVREAIESAKHFANRAEEILKQVDNTKFMLCNGKHAKILKKLGNKVVLAMTDMRRP